MPKCHAWFNRKLVHEDDFLLDLARFLEVWFANRIYNNFVSLDQSNISFFVVILSVAAALVGSLLS